LYHLNRLDYNAYYEFSTDTPPLLDESAPGPLEPGPNHWLQLADCRSLTNKHTRTNTDAPTTNRNTTTARR
jgi:hypothetical protein